MLKLKIHDTVETIIGKFTLQLVDEDSIDACCKNVGKVPTKKGIYFWFIPNEAYDALSKYVTISPVIPLYQRAVNGVVYDLVYIGTAGTGKSGNSNLNERLKWHLCTKHNEGAICSGALSTLRAGLGALLADDLIEPNTETEVSDFMRRYMKVYWIAYGDTDKDAIDYDESKLIFEIRPLLNIKGNPNTNNVYRGRRKSIIKKSQSRIGCQKTGGLLLRDAMTTKFHNMSPNIQACLNERANAPGNLKPMIFSSILDLYNDGQTIITARNVREKCLNNFANTPWGGRLPAICNAMRDACNCGATIISEDRDHLDFTISFDKINGQEKHEIGSSQKSNFQPPTPPAKKQQHVSNKSLSHNEVYLITCSNEKKHVGGVPSHLQALSFNDSLENSRQHLIDQYLGANNKLDWNHCLPAHERYIGRTLYSIEVRNAINNNPDKVLIVSALFGIIKPNDLIPDYDLKMDGTLNNIIIYQFWSGKQNPVEDCTLNNVLTTIKSTSSETVFINLLSKAYQKAFCGFIDGVHPPQLNFIPNLVSPPNADEVNFYQRMLQWRKGYLTRRLH